MDDQDKLDRQQTLGATPDTPPPSQPVHGTIGPVPTIGGSTAAQGTQDWIGLQLTGRYRVLRLIGQGGMGVVYLADDCNLAGDQVVIKRPHAHLLTDPTASARFLHEVRSLIRLRHPHICHVRDAGEHFGIPFVVMDYLAGGSLLERRPKGPDGGIVPASAEEPLSWLESVAKALDFVHGKGHVHRDVKPGNVLFDSEGNAFLTDFGIVKALAQSDQPRGMTREGTFLGTPEYTAPEVFAGEDYDGRADQYSLAAVVYELLGGRRPFEGPTPFAIVQKQTATIPTDLQKLNPAIAAEISKAVLKALSSLPEDRYATCLEFAKAVARGRRQALRRGRWATTRPLPQEEEMVGTGDTSSTPPPPGTPEHSPGVDESLVFGRALPLDDEEPMGSVVSPEDEEFRMFDSDSLPDRPNVEELPMLGSAAPQDDFDLGSSLASDTLSLQDDFDAEEPLALDSASEPDQSDLAGSLVFGSASVPDDVIELEDGPGSLAEVITNSIGMKMVLIPAGEFLMGSPDSDQMAYDREKPQHRVRITKPFYLGVYPVTQAEWQRVMGSNPSHFKGDPNRPVEQVVWQDAQEFCRRLSGLSSEEAAGHLYRLPTEAEWEFACRAGCTTPWCFGDDKKLLGEYAWFRDNSGRSTHSVGKKRPNAWGLYDMHGNVWEWCEDWYAAYGKSAVDDPKGRSRGLHKVYRGGAWGRGPGNCRSARRGNRSPEQRSDQGFRVAMTVSE